MTAHPRRRPEIRTSDLPAAGAREHSHPVPRLLAWALGAAGVLVLVTVALLAAYAYSISARLDQVEAYIADRGEQRDLERDQLTEDFRTAVCDVLDSLPTDDTLTDLRIRYGCGPGLTPEEAP